MARPKKKGLDYFPHDVDLSGDEKVETLEATFGLEGYAIYVKLLERIYREGAPLLITEDGLAVMSRKWGVTVEKINAVIGKCCDINLFDAANFVQSKTLFVQAIKKRIEAVKGKRLIWRKKKHIKDEEFSKGKTPPEPVENPESKEKKSKVKKSKVKKMGTASLTDEQFIQALKINPAYQGIDIDRELGKMDAWLLTPKGKRRQKTRQFVINWLNRCDKPIIGGGNGNGGAGDKTATGGIKGQTTKYAGVTQTFDDGVGKN